MECSACPYSEVIEAVKGLVKIKDASDALRLAATRTRTNGKVKKAASLLSSALEDIPPETFTRIIVAAQQICISCSRVSNDNNLSNKGRSFFSIDGHATSSSDPSDSSSPLNNDAATLTLATSYSQAASLSPSPIEPPREPDTVTSLPPDIEDLIRHSLASFVSLPDITDQMLVIARLCGMSLTTFATMKWIPDTLRPMSKQAVKVRWDNIVRRLPIADALSSRPMRSFASASTPNGKRTPSPSLSSETESNRVNSAAPFASPDSPWSVSLAPDATEQPSLFS